ncbi:hypothetical protein OPIT5_17830 [Opitutaceae bacterium TAV5]|nr:hypothetical protein OPIT5_17830 [Opitutaceae bacterium TAV5]
MLPILARFCSLIVHSFRFLRQVRVRQSGACRLLAAGATAILFVPPGQGGIPDNAAGRAAETAKDTAAPNTFLLEPEKFSALGGWIKDGSHITAGNTGGTAFAGFAITTPGSYHIWARSQDRPENQPATRRFRLRINGRDAAVECGAHGHESFYWERVDSRSLEAGVHALEVRDTARFFGRLEAVLITNSELDPNTVERDSLKRFEQQPVQAVRAPMVDDGVEKITLENGAAGVAAELRNDDIVLRLRQARTASGRSSFVREVEFLSGELKGRIWQAGLEPLYLLGSRKSSVSYSAFSPTWPSTEQEDWLLAGRTWSLPADALDAFRAGDARTRFFPASIRNRKTDTIELVYEAGREGEGGGQGNLAQRALVVWHLPRKGFAVRMEVALKPEKAGFYSLAFAAGGSGGFVMDAVKATQLPPLFQFRRVPDVPQMLTSATTPHPMALVESLLASERESDLSSITHGVVADVDGLSKEWSTRRNATYGFTLRGPEGGIQPAVFAPILGGVGSRVAKGGELRSAWWIVTAPQSWAQTMREVDASILGLRDYREPWQHSLTEQALNIIDLIKSGPGFGWYDRLKGPMNIESADTATHAAPLMLLSAARLTGDMEFFERRGLPALEFLLSRPSIHFALSTKGNFYVTRGEDTRLMFKNPRLGTALWQGLNDLTGNLNPWLRERVEAPKKRVDGALIPAWSDKLALYRAVPDERLLREITREAESWAKRAFENPPKKSPGIMPFYNVSFYPYWWDLIDLYELTGSKPLLEYAKQGASLTLAGQWVHPVVQPGEMTLYPGGKLTETRMVWWSGPGAGRLGFPASKPHTSSTVTFDLPEHKVPAWLPAAVGLSLEQPATYYNVAGQDSNLSNIQITVWAANLLRLSGITGDDYWRMYARNALIGRAASYPGYYMSNFMDLQHDPDFPNKGPDLTAFYWHHVPVHLAMLVDYLVTDAEVRTGGAVRFPYSKSQGYVWFSSRVFGGKPGRVFDDSSCWLWLDRNKFGVDTPRVDYLGARSRDKFHLILMNQAQGAVDARALVDVAALGIAEGAVARIRGTDDGERTLAPEADGRYPLTLERGGWAVLTFDATDANPWPSYPPLATKPATLVLEDKAWGELHAFRIRSPFGVDSLYAGLTGAPDGAVVTLLPEGENRVVPPVHGAPCEVSLGNIPMSQDIRFRIRLERTGGATIETPVVTLPGTPDAL